MVFGFISTFKSVENGPLVSRTPLSGTVQPCAQCPGSLHHANISGSQTPTWTVILSCFFIAWYWFASINTSVEAGDISAPERWPHSLRRSTQWSLTEWSNFWGSQNYHPSRCRQLTPGLLHLEMLPVPLPSSSSLCLADCGWSYGRWKLMEADGSMEAIKLFINISEAFSHSTLYFCIQPLWVFRSGPAV